MINGQEANMCDCHTKEHQVCDECQGMRAGKQPKDVDASRIMDAPSPSSIAEAMVRGRIERFGNEIFRCVNEAEQQGMTYSEVVGTLEMVKADLIKRALEAG